MRKLIVILVTTLIATILISGSSVATLCWVWDVHSYNNCSNPDNAEGSQDGSYATIGYEGDDGWIILDWSDTTAPGPSENFTVYGGGGITEDYVVKVINLYMTNTQTVGTGDDSGNNVFTTPATPPGEGWRYVRIEGDATGGTSREDPLTGPEIDAVSWDGP
jgi:hypothetical protein